MVFKLFPFSFTLLDGTSYSFDDLLGLLKGVSRHPFLTRLYGFLYSIEPLRLAGDSTSRMKLDNHFKHNCLLASRHYRFDFKPSFIETPFPDPVPQKMEKPTPMPMRGPPIWRTPGHFSACVIRPRSTSLQPRLPNQSAKFLERTCFFFPFIDLRRFLEMFSSFLRTADRRIGKNGQLHLMRDMRFCDVPGPEGYLSLTGKELPSVGKEDQVWLTISGLMKKFRVFGRSWNSRC